MTTLQSLPKCKRCGYSPSGKNRSNPQNKYYWGCVVQILSDELGYTPNEIHEIIKYKFLTSKLPIETKKTRVNVGILKSTTDLDTKEFEELMSKVRQWASIELGIYITEPNEITDETHKTWFD